MGTITTLTTKGQVSIPKHVRDELGLKPHDNVVDGEGGPSLRRARPPLRELLGNLPANGRSVEVALTRAEELRGRDLATEYLTDCR